MIQVAFPSNYISRQCAVARRWPQHGRICMQLLAVSREKRVHLGGKKKHPNYMYTQLMRPWEIEIFLEMIRLIPNYGCTRIHTRARPHAVNLLY